MVNGVAVGGGDYGVLVYARGQSYPKFFTNSSLPYYYFCAYDPNGNLYIDGYGSNFSTVWLAVLCNGSDTIVPLNVKEQIGYPGGLQWVGGLLALYDPHASTLYRFAIRGSKAILKGTTSLEGGSDVSQFWIGGSVIVGGNYNADSVSYWKYPAGGAAFATISNVDTPQGVVVSRRR